jgi:hypothetical protein
LAHWLTPNSSHVNLIALAGATRSMPSKDFPAEMERRGFAHKRGTGGVRLFLGIELLTGGPPWSK